MLMRFYRDSVLSESQLQKIRALGYHMGISSEHCFYAEVTERLNERELEILTWLLGDPSQPEGLRDESFLGQQTARTIVEVGPRLNFETAFSTTAVEICRGCGLNKVVRLERSLRMCIDEVLVGEEKQRFLLPLYDRMTQMPYDVPLQSFYVNLPIEPVRLVPLIENGISAIREVNARFGLAMDEADMEYARRLFAVDLRRNPFDLELIDLGTLNSDHARHRTFGGRYFVDGIELPQSSMQVIKEAWQLYPGNSEVGFGDNCSAIRGGSVVTWQPLRPGQPSPYTRVSRIRHITRKAESHCHPSRIEPFEGAQTCIGGEIRDRRSPGRGGVNSVGAAGYSVGNTRIPGYERAWEENPWGYPPDGASPLEILIRASDGMSAYGNCIGQPLTFGYTRTLGIELPWGYRGYFKPIVFGAGIGELDEGHREKGELEPGMVIVLIGGPGYRIGVGGAPASSLDAGQNAAELDFASVQRGDPEMEQRANRVIQCCVELGEENPIVRINDLGGGGVCTSLTEVVFPAGARIDLRAIPVGDKTLSASEIWVNEGQERYAIVLCRADLPRFTDICERENVPFAVVGEITGDGWLTLYDSADGSTLIHLPLDKVLGDLPRKDFQWESWKPQLLAASLPEDLTVREALDGVLRLESVCSKAFLTRKADRSVTGLVAQQQCVGPAHLPISDYAVTASSYFGLSGSAASIGEQPLKGLVSPARMARLSLGEAILNMIGAKVTKLEDMKFLANWFAAARHPGEGAAMYEAASALRDMLKELRTAIDGGKDSMSMAFQALTPDGKQGSGRAPVTLIITATGPMPDITCKVTPNLKAPRNSLIFLDLGGGQRRLGGSALLQTLGQVGNDVPDLVSVSELARAFQIVQRLVKQRLVVSVHDRSDGGLLTAVLEMAFAGNVGLSLDFPATGTALEQCFNEELGVVLETSRPEVVLSELRSGGLSAHMLGVVGLVGGRVVAMHNGKMLIDEPMLKLRSIWEETSTQIDFLQANPVCVQQEKEVNSSLVTLPPYQLSFRPPEGGALQILEGGRPKVAVLREEGSNSDREMAVVLDMVGFEPWDVTTRDLSAGRASLREFRGIVLVGGFSFRDTLGAGKGWAGVIRFNQRLQDEFAAFFGRPDTFSLGVCNGCQVMTLLGWVPGLVLPESKWPRFVQNRSERFESRYPAVKVVDSPAIMFKDMAGSILGIWQAHGEGRLDASAEVLREITDRRLAPLCFVNYEGKVTNQYPFNPNGSPAGITALCSPDGRHLAMMPHPERSFLKWQLPWVPPHWQKFQYSPWPKLFRNAYEWCLENR